MNVKVSIGILAYNESSIIGKTLNSLLQQSLFFCPDPNWSIEIVVVPNGCTDDTASVARLCLQSLLSSSADSCIRWKVCELAQGGKSNAWNSYVHELSDSNVDYIFLMDADIELLQPKTLFSMIKALENNPEAWVAVDKPVKDIVLKPNRNLMEQLSALVSGLSGAKANEDGPAWLCGQLYCAKANVLRKIWLPAHLSVEDGFLYKMIVTDGLQSPEIPARVILAKSASHSFEAYTKISRLLRHEKWLIIANSINEILYEELSVEGEPNDHVGLLIRQRNEQNPNWVSECIRAAGDKEGWLVPKFILSRRFKGLSYQNFTKGLLLFPVAIVAFLLDLLLSIQANFELHRTGKLGYWGK